MTHRLGFRGYVLAWSVGIFYVLMLLTSPTEVAPATLAVIKGIVTTADAAGEGVGQVHQDIERHQLEQDIRAELETELRQQPVDNNRQPVEPGIESEPLPDGEGEGALLDITPVEGGSRYLGPTEGLPDYVGPEQVWQSLQPFYWFARMKQLKPSAAQCYSGTNVAVRVWLAAVSLR